MFLSPFVYCFGLIFNFLLDSLSKFVNLALLFSVLFFDAFSLFLCQYLCTSLSPFVCNVVRFFSVSLSACLSCVQMAACL